KSLECSRAGPGPLAPSSDEYQVSPPRSLAGASASPPRGGADRVDRRASADGAPARVDRGRRVDGGWHGAQPVAGRRLVWTSRETGRGAVRRDRALGRRMERGCWSAPPLWTP